jgi:pyrimidine deaminase RibD-like protein
MKLREFEKSDYEIHNRSKWDRILLELCHQVIKGKQDDPIKYGMVAACVLGPDHQTVLSVNEADKDGTRKHAERVAIESYINKYGDIPEGSIIITTLSPCNEDDTEMAAGRFGESCTDLINHSNVRKVYCGYMDPSQHNDHAEYNYEETEDDNIRSLCKKFAWTFLGNEEHSVDENFADGKHPEDKGDSARHGIPKHASISSLRKIAKQGGRKGQLAHWQANMRSGHNKKNNS